MLSKNPLKSLLPLLGVAAFVVFSACSDNDSHSLNGPEAQIESSDQGKLSSSTDAKSSSSSKAKSSSSADVESCMPLPKLPTTTVGFSSSTQSSSSAVSSSSEAGVTACSLRSRV